MPLRRPLATLAALSIALVGLTGCGSSKNGPEATASSTGKNTVETPSTTAPTTTKPTDAEKEDIDSLDASTRTWEASEFGVRVTAQIPSKWESDGAEPYVEAPAPNGAHLSVQFAQVPKGTTLDEYTKRYAAELSSQAGTSAVVDPGQATVDGNRALTISGAFDHSGLAVGGSASICVVLVDGPSGPVAVGFIQITASGDTEGRATLDEIMDTVTIS